MNGVNIHGHLRKGFSCHIANQRKWWRTLFCWLIDICQLNAFLLSRGPEATYMKDDHKHFHDKLCHKLMTVPLNVPLSGKASTHI